jgi:hypothetical protein
LRPPWGHNSLPRTATVPARNAPIHDAPLDLENRRGLWPPRQFSLKPAGFLRHRRFSSSVFFNAIFRRKLSPTPTRCGQVPGERSIPGGIDRGASAHDHRRIGAAPARYYIFGLASPRRIPALRRKAAKHRAEGVGLTASDVSKLQIGFECRNQFRQLFAEFSH